MHLRLVRFAYFEKEQGQICSVFLERSVGCCAFLQLIVYVEGLAGKAGLQTMCSMPVRTNTINLWSPGVAPELSEKETQTRISLHRGMVARIMKKIPQVPPLTSRTCGAHGDQLKVKPSPQCFSQDLRTVPRISWLGCGITTMIVSFAV